MKRCRAKSDDTLREYFNQIKRTPLLTFDEELELSRRIQGGDQAAMKRLIEANLRLVVKIAKSYVTNDVGFLDIVQEGNIGLIKAASKYDYRRNVRFSTYAAWWIKQSIVRSLSNKRRSIRLPHRKEEALKKIQKTFFSLSQELSREPSTKEVADELHMPENDVVSVLNISGSVASLDSEIGNDSGTLLDLYEDNTFNPDRELFDKDVHDETLRFLDHLVAKERRILLYRYSFLNGKKYTLKRIGEELGISPETVRQIEMRAIKKLREHADELREYVYN